MRLKLRAFLRIQMDRISRRVAPSMFRRLVPVPPNRAYVPLYYPGKITLFRPMEGPSGMYRDPAMGSRGLAAEMEVHDIPGDRFTIFKELDVQALAEKLKICLDDSAP